MLITLNLSTSKKYMYIAKHLIHSTETFAVKLLQIVVSNVGPTKVLKNYQEPSRKKCCSNNAGNCYEQSFKTNFE